MQSRTAGEGAIPGRSLPRRGSLAVLRDELRPDYRFDPRTRGWYQQALATAAPVRTSPYVFFTTREVGTTVAQRSVDGGAWWASTSRFRISPATSPDPGSPRPRGWPSSIGWVSWSPFPEAGRLVRADPSAAIRARRLDDLGDPVLGRSSPRASPGGAAASRSAIEDRAWIGVKRPIEADAGDPLILLLAAPRDELVAGARGLASGSSSSASACSG